MGKSSCCCGATPSKPCLCMKQDVMSCSAKAPMCPCYKALAEKKGAEQWKPMPQCEECGAVEGGNIDGCDDCDITYWFNGKVYHPDSMIHIGAETNGATCASCSKVISEDDIIGDGTNRGLCCVPDYYDEDYDAESKKPSRVAETNFDILNIEYMEDGEETFDYPESMLVSVETKKDDHWTHTKDRIRVKIKSYIRRNFGNDVEVIDFLAFPIGSEYALGQEFDAEYHRDSKGRFAEKPILTGSVIGGLALGLMYFMGRK